MAAAVTLERARDISTRTLCWQVPGGAAAAGPVAAALVEGTILSDYRFETYKSTPDGDGAQATARPSGWSA